MSQLDREERILKAMRHAEKIEPGKGVGSSYLALVTEMSKTEVNRGLNSLIASGDVIREGRHTHTKYVLSKAIRGIVAHVQGDKKRPGRPVLPDGEQKKQKTVRVSDEDMAHIVEHGFTLQTLLDQAIGSLKPITPEEIRLSLNTLSRAISKEGLC